MPKLEPILIVESTSGWGESWLLPLFVQEDARVLASRVPKLTPEQEAANEQEHKIKRGEMPKW